MLNYKRSMNEKDTIEIEGVVSESLPNALFVVELSNGHVIKATLGGKMRLNRISLLPGDKVLIKLSVYDLSRGRIIYRK